jgi:hypothetical protein
MGKPRWRSVEARASGAYRIETMKPLIGLASLGLILASAPAFAADSGRLTTMERGQYVCEMPGDAASQRGVPVPEQSFKVINASAYVAGGKRGKYLRLGENVTMTTGPLKANRYVLKNDRFLRQVSRDGEFTGLRCVKQGG